MALGLAIVHNDVRAEATDLGKASMAVELNFVEGWRPGARNVLLRLLPCTSALPTVHFTYVHFAVNWMTAFVFFGLIR